jgi:large subunit ribosomal protein L24
MRIKKGDTVVVLSGQYKNQTGKVTATYPAKRQVMVEGVNVKTKHRKPTSTNNKGGIEKAERPLDVSKVALLRPGGAKKNLGSRVGFILDKSGNKKRVYRQAGNKEVK